MESPPSASWEKMFVAPTLLAVFMNIYIYIYMIYIYIILLLYAYHSACHIVASLKVFLHGPRPTFKKCTDSHGVWDNALILARSPCGNIPISKHICICTICACILFRIKCKPTTGSPRLLHLAQVGPRIPARALELEETGPE